MQEPQSIAAQNPIDLFLGEGDTGFPNPGRDLGERLHPVAIGGKFGETLQSLANISLGPMASRMKRTTR